MTRIRNFLVLAALAIPALPVYFMGVASADDLGEKPIAITAPVEVPDLPSSAVKVCSDLVCNTNFGSGVYIGGGYFLTARHVAEIHPDGYIWTLKADNGRVFKATTLWMMGDADLAVMQISQADNAPAFVFPSSGLSCESPFQGQAVTAIGNPAMFVFVHVDGKIVTAAQDVGDKSQGPFWKDVFVMDMTVTGGFSGGPIFDAAGKVIGLLVGALQGTGYSIMEPTDKLCGLLPTVDAQ
jgi:S1-C subfamily serine protease